MNKTTERKIDETVWIQFTNGNPDIEEIAQETITAREQGTELPSRMAELIEDTENHYNDSND
jgi:hypothetical protein